MCQAALASQSPHYAVPSPPPPGFPPTITAGPYDELLQRLISAHKERQAWLLTGVLGSRLAGAVQALVDRAQPHQPPDRIVLVPIPSSRQAVRSRGRDATRAIATATAHRLARQSVARVSVARMLRPVRKLADQSALNAAQRRANLEQAYRARTRVLSRMTSRSPATETIIIDDLVTTGASLAEARRALDEADISVLGAAVVAATVRRTR